LLTPVGSIYIEYYNQPAPQSLWPNLTWQDISSFYSGLFFRTSGGDAASWGTTQAACAPLISELGYAKGGTYQQVVSVPASGYSPYVHMGRTSSGTEERGFRVNTTSCETRPKNQAIRIWKRTA